MILTGIDSFYKLIHVSFFGKFEQCEICGFHMCNPEVQIILVYYVLLSGPFIDVWADNKAFITNSLRCVELITA
jgi:hypothetical protein